MGTSYHVSVVYGVEETEAMREARNTTYEQEQPVCPKQHKIDRWSPPQFCSQCGSAVETQMVTVPYTTPPQVAYATADLDREDECLCMDSMQHLVHEDAPNCSDSNTILGVTLLYKDPHCDTGTYDIPVPTPEQVEQVRTYIKHLGLTGVTLKTHLILGAM
ncbi:hypothetical protein N9917_01465 [Deltaproteobacteria bacterium]|nr:hypothetical protein [Deltaproteobacteria bacterium]